MEGAEQADIPLQTLTFQDLQPYLDWRIFKAAYGLKNESEGEEQVFDYQDEALCLLKRENAFFVRLSARFFSCYNDENSICEKDGLFAFPMLRDERTEKMASLADFYPSKSSGKTHLLGLFALSAKENPDLNDARILGSFDDSLFSHAIKAMLAQAASHWLQTQWGVRPQG